MKTLNDVVHIFKDTSASDKKGISDLKQAWIKNENNKAAISYEYAFELGEK